MAKINPMIARKIVNTPGYGNGRQATHLPVNHLPSRPQRSCRVLSSNQRLVQYRIFVLSSSVEITTENRYRQEHDTLYSTTSPMKELRS